MKSNVLAAVLATSIIFLTGMVHGACCPVAGSATVGVTAQEASIAAVGWSAQKQILHKPVYNNGKKKIGVIEDIIVSPENSVSYAVVGVGGFLGIDRHDVLIPFNHFKAEGHEYLLPGANKAMLNPCLYSSTPNNAGNYGVACAPIFNRHWLKLRSLS